MVTDIADSTDVRDWVACLVRPNTQHLAERERAIADSTPTPQPTWYDAATGLIDAIVGLYLAPVTSRL